MALKKNWMLRYFKNFATTRVAEYFEYQFHGGSNQLITVTSSKIK